MHLFNRFVNFGKLFLGNSIGQVIALALYPYVARFYLPSDFSLFGYMTSLTMVLSVFATGQFHTALLNPENNDEARKLIGLSTVSVTIFSTLTLFFFWFWDSSLLIVSLYLFFYSLFEIQKMSYIRGKSYSKSAISQIVFRLFGNGGKLFPSFVQLKSTGLLLAEICSLILVVTYGLKESIFNWKWDLGVLKKYKNFPLFQTFTMAMNIFLMDFPILFWTGKFSKEMLGYFVMGQKLIILPAMVVSNAVQNSSVHSLIESGQPLKHYCKLILLLIVVGIACVFGFHLFGIDLLTFLLGKNWKEGESVFLLLSFLMVSKFIFAIPQATFVLRNMTKRTFLLRLTQITILLLCIPKNLGFYESLKFYIVVDIIFDVILIIWGGFIIRPPYVFRPSLK